MVKKIITEISEEDFRKLDITVYKHEMVDGRLHYVPYKINDILDEEIDYVLKSGYESDLIALNLPVTVAIHEDNFGDVDPKEFAGLHGYFDKFMNMYSGITTYYIGWGIRHLYSTRDYYEDHDDYWRVRKDETKVIYRVKLSTHWLDQFVLKHKSVITEWVYNHIPEGIDKDKIKDIHLCVNYDLDEYGSWLEKSRYCIIEFDHSEHHIPVDANGHELKYKGNE